MASQEEIRRRVTNEIVAALKAGTRPWVRPWSALENSGMPTNVVSGNPYSGINILLLSLVAQARGYQSQYWGTYNQWYGLGCHVKKRPEHIPAGQYGTRCILFKPISKTRVNSDGEEEEHRFFLMREFVLFNAEQVMGPGIEDYLAKPRPDGGFVDFQPAEDAIAATGANIRHGGDKACYRPGEDVVLLPPKEAFSKASEYYATILHELTHWTGHESRLNRLHKLARFGSQAYAVEELVAEMGGSFLCAELGIVSDDLSNTTAYLANWLHVLEKDHNAIFTASSAASRAADFILSFSKEPVQEEATVAS